MQKGLLTFLFVLLMAGPNLAKADTYRLVTAAFKPFTDPNHPKGGFLVEIAREALKTQGHKIKIEYRPWPRAMAAAENGRYDGLLSAFYNSERGKTFYFSAPLNTTQMVFVGMKEHFSNFGYASLNDLTNYKIAVGRKWAYSEEFESNQKLNKVNVNDEPHGIKLLYNNRVDLFAVNSDQFKNTIISLKDYPSEKSLILSPAISTNDQHIAAPRSSEKSLKFLSDFNTGLAAIKANGTYSRIRADFFGF